MGYIQSFFVYLITFFIVIKFIKYIKVNQKISILIFLWHSIFCFLYLNYSISNFLDSTGYYYVSFVKENLEFRGNDIIIGFTSIFSKYMGFNQTSCFLVFNLFGSLGQILFYKNIQPFIQKIKSKYKLLVSLTIWLPTIHFWTAGIGKDALIYFLLNLSIFSLYNLQKRVLLLFPSLILISLIRPHIGITIFLSVLIAVFFKINLPRNYRFILRFITIIAFFYFLNIGAETLKIGTDLSTANIDLILDRVDYHRGATELGGSSVDMNSMNIFNRLFTYMFRPIFLIDGSSFFVIFASIDNLILFSIFIYPFVKFLLSFKIKKLEMKPINLFVLIYTLLTWFFLSATTSNLGLALRHKLMILPGLLIVILDLSTNSIYRYMPKNKAKPLQFDIKK